MYVRTGNWAGKGQTNSDNPPRSEENQHAIFFTKTHVNEKS